MWKLIAKLLKKDAKPMDELDLLIEEHMHPKPGDWRLDKPKCPVRRLGPGSLTY